MILFSFTPTIAGRGWDLKAMAMNVLIILGHPRKNSFSGALANSFKKGALLAGMNVKQLILADLDFNPNVTVVSHKLQTLEDDISLGQELIDWADHLVFVYPTWWGTMPALLKGFLDRTLTRGFAFEEIEENQTWKKLLKGKSAQLITTMDTPSWVYRWIYRSPGKNAMGQATLGFCGISPVKSLSFSPIKYVDDAQRKNWLDKANQEGLKLKRGILTPWEKAVNHTKTWLKAIRLQFYPMTWIAYTAGAFGAVLLGQDFSLTVFWVGYLWLFLIEVATVLSNEYYDFDTDSKNLYYSPFTGGSRVLVEDELNPPKIRKATFMILVVSLIVAVLLLNLSAGNGYQLTALLLVLSVLALGYTVPPLKLSYRSLGELDVAITHSLGVILCGYIFQGGHIFDPFPWLLSIPLFLGVMPSIILAGIPDYAADKSASKNTLAVSLGQKPAVKVAILFAALATITAIIWHLFVLPEAFGLAIYATVPHAILLIALLYGYINRTDPPARIDSLMIVSLTYVIWFGIVPLIKMM